MAKNLTEVHTKLDRILERLSKLDSQIMTDRRRADAQINLMTRMLGIMPQEARDMSAVMVEALRASRESAERTAEILKEIRTD